MALSVTELPITAAMTALLGFPFRPSLAKSSMTGLRRGDESRHVERLAHDARPFALAVIVVQRRKAARQAILLLLGGPVWAGKPGAPNGDRADDTLASASTVTCGGSREPDCTLMIASS